mmetsp:Transcript_3849/g.9330  ORF Transcript_3849/g.9330 Transcript_3849/m.9330 type:complete len:113 (-) Transcript_3849:35-373(-)
MGPSASEDMNRAVELVDATDAERDAMVEKARAVRVERRLERAVIMMAWVRNCMVMGCWMVWYGMVWYDIRVRSSVIFFFVLCNVRAALSKRVRNKTVDWSNLVGCDAERSKE